MCWDTLEREIAEVSPKRIICLGAVAAKILIDDPKFKITKQHGKVYDFVYDFEGREVVAMYHPAYLLRQGGLKNKALADEMVEVLKGA